MDHKEVIVKIVENKGLSLQETIDMINERCDKGYIPLEVADKYKDIIEETFVLICRRSVGTAEKGLKRVLSTDYRNMARNNKPDEFYRPRVAYDNDRDIATTYGVNRYAKKYGVLHEGHLYTLTDAVGEGQDIIQSIMTNYREDRPDGTLNLTDYAKMYCLNSGIKYSVIKNKQMEK